MRGEFVDIEDQRLYYYAAGRRDKSAGRASVPVVLIHGFPTSSRLWHLVARDFPDGHRLIVVDLPGFGRSDPLPVATGEPGKPCARLARSVTGLLDVLGVESAVMVGHGSGGGVAQALAVTAPARVARLGLVASHAFGVTPRAMTRVARALEPLTRVGPTGLLAGLVHGSARRGFADPARTDFTLDTCLRPFTNGQGRAVLTHHLAASVRCDTAEWSPRLGTFASPAAVIWGRDDPFLPTALGERLAAAIPGATFEVLAGARHFVPEDTPDQLTRAIRRLLER
jgi:pimeloyl-ACP methyl ester carboxylesterase